MEAGKNILGLKTQSRSIPFTLYTMVGKLILLANIIACASGLYRDYLTIEILSAGILLLLFCQLLFRKGHIYIATALMILVYNGIIFWVAFNVGRASGAMLYYYPMIVGMLFVFLYNYSFAGSLSLISIPLISMIFILILTRHKSAFFFLPDASLDKIYLTNLVLSIAGTTAIVIALYYHFMRMHRSVIRARDESYMEMLRELDLQRERDSYALLLSIRDDISQTLASSRLYLQMHPDQQEFTRKADEHVKAALLRLNEISNQLSPSMLVDLGLKEGLDTYAIMLSEQYGISVKIELMPGSGLLAEPERISLYRILQQCINILARQEHPAYLHLKIGHRFGKLTLVADHGGGNLNFIAKMNDTTNRDLSKRLLYYNARIHEIKGQIRIEMDMPG